MDSAHYVEQIERAEAEVRKVRDTMEALVPPIVQAVTAEVTEWGKQAVERTVVSKPEVTKALAPERLSELKAMLRELLERLPELASTELQADDSLWPHRGKLARELENDYGATYTVTRKFSDQLNSAVRSVRGHVGALLVEFGYERFTRDGEWEQRQGKHPIYRYGMGPRPELDSAVKNYTAMIEQLIAAIKAVWQAEKAKEAADAKALWDSV